MRVKFYKTTGTVIDIHEIATPLSDGLTGPDSFDITRSQNIELASYFRGDAIEPKDRENAQTQVSFTSSKTHSTLVDSEAYALDIGETLADSVGRIEFEAYDLTGAKKVRYMDPAAIQSVQSSYSGCTTFHRITIVGGKMIQKGR